MRQFSFAPPAATTGQPVATRHLGVLDFLRGFAALSVCLFHFSRGVELTKLHSPLLQLAFAKGYVGVAVFFVISGFVLPYSLWHTGYRVQNFGAYLARRIVRLCPPAYLASALILLKWAVSYRWLHHGSAQLQQVSSAQLLANALLVVPFTQYHWINAVCWTLALEFQFYILLGLGYNQLFTTARPGRFLAFWVGLHALQWLPFLPAQNFFQYSTLFAMGGASLLYYQQKIAGRHYALALLIFFVLGGGQLGWWTATFGLATALAIVVVRGQYPFFSFAGKISYSLYLTHFLIGSSAEFLLVRYFPPHSPLAATAAIGACAMLAVAGAYLYFLVAEKPFIQLARRIKL